jgi:Domain of unknown function (DUF4874)/Domain of unknown function (DUF4832)
MGLTYAVLALAGCGGSGSVPASIPRAASNATMLRPAAGSCTTVAMPYRLTCTFTPNAVTISTSEGAPYGDVDFWITPFDSSQTNFGYGPTKVMRLYICLSGMVTTNACSKQPTPVGPLSHAMLAKIAAGIEAYRGTGIRVMPRFVYNLGPIGAPDASLPVIMTHLAQLAPILRRNSDVVFGLEAGFFGTWGEWHNSTHGNMAADHVKALLGQELADFGTRFPVFVRYPGLTLIYTNGNTTPMQGLGMHDDSYAYPPNDAGTFVPSGHQNPRRIPVLTLRTYAQAQAEQVGLVGEPFGTNCSKVDRFAYRYSLQSYRLNSIHCADAAMVLSKAGTRIVLQRAVLSGTVQPGSTMTAALTFVNDGYGRVMRVRPVTLVLRSGTTILSSAPVASIDLRTLAPARQPVAKTFTFAFTLPSTLPKGKITASLFIADPAPSLRAMPAYALPLNSHGPNGEIFDAATGLNAFATIAR